MTGRYPAGGIPERAARHQPGAALLRRNAHGTAWATGVFQQIDGIRTASPVQHLASKVDIGVDVPELTVVGQPIDVVAEVSDPTRVFQARLVNAIDQTVVATQRLQPADGRYTTAFTDIPPGAYAMIVGWRIHPVRCTIR